MDSAAQLLAQLAGQSPLFVAYAAGIVLALVLWRRCPVPAALTLVAGGLLLLTSIGQIVASQRLIQARADMEIEADALGAAMVTIGVVGSLLRALAFGLLIAAVFVGRKPIGDARP